MNVYTAKQRWKYALGAIALIIVFLSLLYTDYLVRKIAKDEREKIQIWAKAIENRAKLLTYTEELFNNLGKEERSKVEIWAGATSLLVSTFDENTRNYCLKVITANTSIPAIVVDRAGNINAAINIDSTKYPLISKFEGQIMQDFSVNAPIIISDEFGNSYYIRYTDSRLVEELKENMKFFVQSFLTEVSNSSNVPVIVTDSTRQNVYSHGNCDTAMLNNKAYLKNLLAEMESENEPIDVTLAEIGRAKIFYKDSFILNQLKYYPYIQFAVIALFIIVGYILFSIARRAEQNLVWVGMAKETAHQLGTPLSSLLGWVEYLKTKDLSEETISEITKDVNRLETITERFSKIGAAPQLDTLNLSEVIDECIGYMRPRVSNRVNFTINTNGLDEISAKLNKPLFEWVMENLTRNAVDAMAGEGHITINLLADGNNVMIDFTDTGKGIAKKRFNTVFEPGYTSKKRGWGLGLSLTKRIMEEYHGGRIFVKSSEIGRGTTFRLVLKRG